MEGMKSWLRVSLVVGVMNKYFTTGGLPYTPTLTQVGKTLVCEPLSKKKLMFFNKQMMQCSVKNKNFKAEC